MTQALLTDTGREKVAQLLGDDITALEIGSDSSSPSTDDDGVRSHVVSKSTTPEDAGGGSRSFNIRLDTTESNGETLGEIAAVDDSGNGLSRIAFAEIPKTQDFEVEFTVTKTVVNE